MKNYRTYKSIKNRYDIGKLPTSSGTQLPISNVNPTLFNAKAGYSGYEKDADEYSRAKTANTVSDLANAASQAYNLYGTMFNTSSIGSTVGEAAKEGAKEATKSSAGSTAGYITGGLMTALNLYNAIDSLGNFRNRVNASDIQNLSSIINQTKYGESYQTFGGFDEQGIKNYTSSQNSADELNTTLKGMNVGMSAGSTIGSIWGPLGYGIGAAAGALTGLGVGALFGRHYANKRARKVENDINNMKGSQYGYNMQSEADAATRGLLRLYNQQHSDSDAYFVLSDKGKSPNMRTTEGEYGTIMTPKGLQYGQIKGLASPDEGEINIATGETHYNGSKNMNTKDRRADVVPTGDAGDGSFERNVGIPGHQYDTDGVTFADKARPYFKQNEQIKDELERVEKGKGDKATKKYMITRLRKQYSDNSQAITNIVNRQSRLLNFRNRLFDDGLTPGMVIPSYFENREWMNDLLDVPKVPKYNFITLNTNTPQKPTQNKSVIDKVTGLISKTGSSMSPMLGLAAKAPYLIQERTAADAEQPYAQNSYVPNYSADGALRVLGSLGYDPSSELSQLTRTQRLNVYNIRNTGGLSSGLRAAMINSSNAQLASQVGSILSNAYDKNALFKQAYANTMMQSGQNEATRAQQALATQQEAYRQAVGAKQKLQEQSRKNRLMAIQQTLQDMSTNSFYNKWLNLYDR